MRSSSFALALLLFASPANAAPDPRDDPADAHAGDGVVNKVRALLQEGVMEVTGPVTHDGTETWAVSGSIRSDWRTTTLPRSYGPAIARMMLTVTNEPPL